MNIKNESKETSYLPVPWVYREVVEEQILKKNKGKVFYFCDHEGICEQEGAILSMEDIPQKGLFINLDNQSQIRVDRIITLFGKPGAAYDEYEAYNNACMDCSGGYDKDELKGYSI